MMKRPLGLSRKKRLQLSGAVGIAVALLLLLVWQVNLFGQTRLRVHNLYYIAQPTSGKVVIVVVDDATLNAYGRSLTDWPRSRHAELIETVSQGGARVIALDILFVEPSDDDALVADAINNARQSEAGTRTILPLAILQSTRGDDLLVYDRAMMPVEPIHEASYALGTSNTSRDADGMIRRIPLIIDFQNTDWPAFSVVTFLSYLGVPPAAYPEVLKSADGELEITPQHVVPVDDTHQMMLNYFGPPYADTFPTYSYQAVLSGEVDPAVFRDKIVLVGLANATGATDNYPVPVSFDGQMMSGVEIHANAIETLLQDRALHPQSDFSQALTILFFSLVASLLYGQMTGRNWRVALIPILLIGALVAWGVFGVILFNTNLLVINLFDTSLALILPALVMVGIHAATEMTQRQRTELLLDSALAATTQELNLEGLLASLAHDCTTLLGTTGGASPEIWLQNPMVHQLERLYPPPPLLDDSALPDASLLRNLAKDVSRSPHFKLAQSALNTGTYKIEKGVLALPLIWHTKQLGVIICEYHQRRLPATMLDLFAWQSAALVANGVSHHEISQLSDFKTRLIRIASHDIKTPLNTVMIYGEMLLEQHQQKSYLDEGQVRQINAILDASVQMNQIVNEILNIDRAQRGVLIEDIYSLPHLLETAIQRNQRNIAGKNQTLTTDIPPNLPAMRGDYAQLREAFYNLINNASKYSHPGEQIRVAVELHEADKVVWVQIQDTGYGIPKAAQAKLFTEFYRVKTEQTAKIEGSGLGLSLVKAVVEAHKGRVWVESEEGKGSTFFVELPIPPTPEKQPPHVILTQKMPPPAKPS